VSVGAPDATETWTIASLANDAGTPGFVNGAAATARFRKPTGLYFDAATSRLYVADSGNHAIRAIDLAGGVPSATVVTVAGTPATRGYFGDGGAATSALLYAPEAITRCPNGDLFIADTGNHRVRRVAGTTISTVLGVGVAASSGEGAPASSFPVEAPRGLACDGAGNIYATSSSAVRLIAADASMTVDGTGSVLTIYGKSPRTSFPSSVTRCVGGLALAGPAVQITDSCSGLLVELTPQPVTP
jgi:sugar lactone lactonase YvrE